LAINAAGLIPYRTGFYTIDMLGLNDRHIAMAAVTDNTSARSFVGHFKHDGSYVCEQRPDIVLTSGATLHRGRNSQEAAAQAALNTFPGDREFLTTPDCRDRYRELVAEIVPDGYVVVLVHGLEKTPLDIPPAPESAEDWFREGLRLMQSARLEEAVEAFDRSLTLNDGNPAAMTNLAFCLSDLQRYMEAVPLFEEALHVSPGGLDALFGLALARENLGQSRLASELYRRYIAVAPESVWKERARDHLFGLTGKRR
jgi:hypothetical protein